MIQEKAVWLIFTCLTIQSPTFDFSKVNTVTVTFNFGVLQYSHQFSKVNTADNTVINVWVLETEITFFIADILWHQYNLNRTIEKNNRDEIY